MNYCVGDTATIDIIESNQDNKWNWRVIHYQPDPKFLPESILCSSKTNENPNSVIERSSDLIIKTPIKINEILYEKVTIISVEIKNDSASTDYTLTNVTFMSDFRKVHVELLEFWIKNGSMNSPILIRSKELITVHLKCVGKNPGYVKNRCIFDFKESKSTSFIEFNVISPFQSKNDESLNIDNQSTGGNERFIRSKQYESFNVIHSEKPFLAPTFLPKKLPRAFIPDLLWDSYENDDDLLENFHWLDETLSFENYEKKFTTLLHLEELEMKLQISQVNTKSFYCLFLHFILSITNV